MEVNRLDRHIPLEDRVWAALERTCRVHQPDAPCLRCAERWAAVMQAFSYERDLLSRHDAIVETVVRDRIAESRRAERYRLAWESARRGRFNYRHLFVCEQDRVAHAESHHEWDLQIAAHRVRYWKSQADRYRLAWKSACQGRKRWYELYLAALNFPSRLNDMSFVRAAHRNASAVRRLSLEKAELESELSDLRLAFSELQGAQAREVEA